MEHTGPAPASATTGYYLLCISGPDHGKRIALTSEQLLVGRSADANLLSDDPDVAERFATLDFEGGRLRVRGLATLLPFVDGHPLADAILGPGQQVRFGRSIWQLRDPTAEHSVFGFVNRLGDHLSSAAGVEKPKEWSPGEMFSEAMSKHTDEEIEEYFTVGTRKTTPVLADISAAWPKPWVFIRAFVGAFTLYAAFVAAWNEFHNSNLIPGLIMAGSVAIPLALLIFFFEVNVPRNISLYQVIKLMLIGGILSIFVSLFGFRLTDFDNWLGAAGAGIVEETGKALALLLVVNRPRFRWTLNGLLLGAAVGTGFAVFESAGYAFNNIGGSDLEVMFQVIRERGFLSIFGGHVLWTALVGAALWRTRGEQRFRSDMFFDPRFLRVFGICTAMHMLWNSELGDSLPFFGKYILLGVVAWTLILGIIQGGLRQVREAQQLAT